jgi:hypothetical protein
MPSLGRLLYSGDTRTPRQHDVLTVFFFVVFFATFFAVVFFAAVFFFVVFAFAFVAMPCALPEIY